MFCLIVHVDHLRSHIGVKYVTKSLISETESIRKERVEFFTIPLPTDSLADVLHKFGLANFFVILIIGVVMIASLISCIITLVVLIMWNRKRRRRRKRQLL